MGRQVRYKLPSGATFSDVKSDDHMRKARIKFNDAAEVDLFLEWANLKQIDANQYKGGVNEVHVKGVGFNGAENAIVVIRD